VRASERVRIRITSLSSSSSSSWPPTQPSAWTTHVLQRLTVGSSASYVRLQSVTTSERQPKHRGSDMHDQSPTTCRPPHPPLAAPLRRQPAAQPAGKTPGIKTESILISRPIHRYVLRPLRFCMFAQASFFPCGRRTGDRRSRGTGVAATAAAATGEVSSRGGTKIGTRSDKSEQCHARMPKRRHAITE
jgi:hypothetical protein